MADPTTQASNEGLGGLGPNLGGIFDPGWYRARYRDVASSVVDPLTHFLNWGLDEGRDPNRYFDGAWYREHNADVAASGINPFLHYLQSGAAELRNPHPRFDAIWYVDQHPEAARNPLLHHMLVGAAQGWLTEKPLDKRDFLPSTAAPFACPPDIAVDVVVPVFRGLAETKRCLNSVLADRDRPAGRILVVDDHSPEPELVAWLDQLAAGGQIMLLRNRRNLGFVASVNAGMRAAAPHDVVLLNSDTEVPAGWLRRLAAQAYAAPRIASVSPLSNNATICSYPGSEGSGTLPLGMTLAQVDAACRSVNAGRRVLLPTTVGFCMYIRRAALDHVGLFDEETFGQGYGEENDFCLRAAAQGWSHVLACDTFVYHQGSVSFGANAAVLAERGIEVLCRRYPGYRGLIANHVKQDAAGPFRFAVTAALLRQSGLPVILMVSHALGGGVQQHVDALVRRLDGAAHALLLRAGTRGPALTLPALPGHAEVSLPADRLGDLASLLQSCGVSRVHIHHLLGMDLDVRKLLHRLEVPFDVTVHDYFALCPQVNLLPWKGAHYCGEPGPAACNACIADMPSHNARDILAWRSNFSWLFREAERVFCPSEDVRRRLERFGLAERAVVAPHEAAEAGPWPLHPPKLRGGKLRVALLGVLAPHKGAHTVMSVVAAADPKAVEFHLIGYAEEGLPEGAADGITVTGEYPEHELPALLAKVKPHVVWFPAQWPETYSYTLSAAIEAGLPIVASRIGAFPERLDGRPLSWLLDPRAP
ncbi:MAG TPA: glycosyltransferase, partial [Acetobacteraceae bacterium]|nr:glycosyltransferase [Acetobacteraceae bacterium]